MRLSTRAVAVGTDVMTLRCGRVGKRDCNGRLEPKWYEKLQIKGEAVTETKKDEQWKRFHDEDEGSSSY